MPSISQLSESIAKFIRSSDKAYKFTDGGDTETVTTDSGVYPTFAKAIKDFSDSAIVESIIEEIEEQLPAIVEETIGSLSLSSIDGLEEELAQKLNTSVYTTHVGSGGAAHAAATTTQNGFLSSSDKIKINSIYVSSSESYSIGLWNTVTSSPSLKVVGGDFHLYGEGITVTMASSWISAWRNTLDIVPVDALDSSSATRPLSAKQGKNLFDIKTNKPVLADSEPVNGGQGFVLGGDVPYFAKVVLLNAGTSDIPDSDGKINYSDTGEYGLGTYYNISLAYSLDLQVWQINFFLGDTSFLYQTTTDDFYDEDPGWINMSNLQPINVELTPYNEVGTAGKLGDVIVYKNELFICLKESPVYWQLVPNNFILGGFINNSALRFDDYQILTSEEQAQAKNNLGSIPDPIELNAPIVEDRVLSFTGSGADSIFETYFEEVPEDTINGKPYYDDGNGVTASWSSDESRWEIRRTGIDQFWFGEGNEIDEVEIWEPGDDAEGQLELDFEYGGGTIGKPGQFFYYTYEETDLDTSEIVERTRFWVRKLGELNYYIEFLPISDLNEKADKVDFDAHVGSVGGSHGLASEDDAGFLSPEGYQKIENLHREDTETYADGVWDTSLSQNGMSIVDGELTLKDTGESEATVTLEGDWQEAWKTALDIPDNILTSVINTLASQLSTTIPPSQTVVAQFREEFQYLYSRVHFFNSAEDVATDGVWDKSFNQLALQINNGNFYLPDAGGYENVTLGSNWAAKWRKALSIEAEIIEERSGATLSLTSDYIGKYLRHTHTSASTIEMGVMTIPTGSRIIIRNASLYDITLSPTGLTLNGTTTIPSLGTFTLIYVGSNVWDVIS